MFALYKDWKFSNTLIKEPTCTWTKTIKVRDIREQINLLDIMVENGNRIKKKIKIKQFNETCTRQLTYHTRLCSIFLDMLLNIYSGYNKDLLGFE